MNSPIYNKEYVLIYNNECALTAFFLYENKKKARSTKLRTLLFQSCYLLGYYFSSAKYLMVRTI